MSKMKQTANRGPHILGQKTLDSGAENLTVSEGNTAPIAFSMNQTSAVCLPVLSESKKIIWVHSDQIDLQVDGAAELIKAFDRFPYLTHRQTSALAQRCSLQPDQVKVWFIARRLQYGISWDYKDILDVRRKFKSPQTNAQGKKDLLYKKKGDVKEDRRKMKRKVKVSGGIKAEEVREEQSAKGGRMIEDNVRVYELLAGQLMKKDDRKAEEGESNMLKKQKRMAATEKLGKKRIKQDSERAGQIEDVSDEAESEGQKCTESETTLNDRHKRKVKVNKRMMSRHTKTVTQQESLKTAFSHCQYPDREQYSRLAELVGIPRYVVVQWFGDMRYYLKKGKPRWMTQEKYHQALANIKYRQCINALARMEQSEGAAKTMVESSEGCDSEESVNVTPE